MQRFATHVMLSSGLKRAFLALLAGALAALALPPFSLLFLPFVSFTILVLLIDGATADPDSNFVARLFPAFRIGFLFGFGYFLVGLWWLANALLVEADEFAWAIPLAVIGLPALLALYYGLAAMLARMVWSDGVFRILALAASFGLAEYLRGVLFTGFPWNAIGQAAAPFPVLMQSVSVVGSLSLNVLAVFVFASPALLAGGRLARSGLALSVLLVVAHTGFGLFEIRPWTPSPMPGTGRIVRLVQADIDQAAKIDDAKRMEIFEEHLALTRAPAANGGKRPDIIIWPETSIPFILTRNPDALSRIAEVLDDGQILVAGAVRIESDANGQEPRYYNSIYMIDSQGQIIGAADKVHLVPFGEFLPFEQFFADLDIVPVASLPGGYSAAVNRQMLTLPDGTTLMPMICYEIVFQDEARNAATLADAIVNVTNDGWFGNTPGPYQHFLQARLRAVETGLPVIRNSNSGISAVIDPHGSVVEGLKFQVKGYVDGEIPQKSVPISNDYVKFLTFGLMETLLFAIAIFSRVSFVMDLN